MTRVSANKMHIFILIFLTGLYYCEDIDDENDLLVSKKGSGERLMDSQTFVENDRIKRSAAMHPRKRKQKGKKGTRKKGKKLKTKKFSCRKKKLAPKCINKKFTNKIKAVEKKLRGLNSIKGLSNKIAKIETSSKQQTSKLKIQKSWEI